MYMVYYLDNDYRVHTEPNSAFISWDDVQGVFNGKSKTYIEGFRVVPDGHVWTRHDGARFVGQMIAAATDFATLQAAQAEYEKAETTIAELDAALLDATYQSIIGGIE